MLRPSFRNRCRPKRPHLHQRRAPARHTADFLHRVLFQVQQGDDQPVGGRQPAQQGRHGFPGGRGGGVRRLRAALQQELQPGRGVGRQIAPAELGAATLAPQAIQAGADRQPRDPMLKGRARPGPVLRQPRKDLHEDFLRRSSSAQRRGRCARTMRITKGYKCPTSVSAACASRAATPARHRSRSKAAVLTMGLSRRGSPTKNSFRS